MQRKPQLLDCAHVGNLAAVCQYTEQGESSACGKKICQDCYVNCDICGATICRRHQEWRDERRKVFCPADARNFFMQKLGRKLLFPGGKDERPL